MKQRFIKSAEVIRDTKKKIVRIIDTQIDEDGKVLKTHTHEFTFAEFSPIKLMEARKKVFK